MLKDQVEMLKVIVTDRVTALMNLIAKVFPTSYALLCRYHITKNARSRVKPTVRTKQIESEDGKMVKAGVVVEKIMDALNRIVKEKIVCACTNKVRHLRNTTTNRVESAHATFKNWLGNSKGDLYRDWDFVNQMIQNQHNEIHTSFGRSITVLEHNFKNNNLYSQLVDNICRAGLNYIFHEAKRVDNVGSDSAKCECTIMKIYGLPCACVIEKRVKLGSLIRLDEV
ncbi:uncharacterized protein LOC127079564 [Lathyrus oleraceus]|uniref:uncharacterized protein LOC127079564 n=1 Tax=Pisum sativum TaxID=3888 RepID=UPI0021CE7888|nr:uncharacterized protein LOC127079564 [Pisum sativum]